MDFWTEIEKILKHSFFGLNISRIVLSIIIISATLTMRRKLVAALIKALSSLSGKVKGQLAERLVKAIELPSHFLFIVIGFWISAEIMNFQGEAKVFIGRGMRSAVVFFVFWTVYRFADITFELLHRLIVKTDKKLDNILVSFLQRGGKVVTVILAAIVIVQEWGYNATGFLAGLGLSGLAVALAAKDTVANFFGSVMIMLDRPFDVGDWIGTPSVEGTVEEVGFRSTRVRTFAQALVTIPNSLMSNDPVTNWSRMGKRRVSFKLGMEYNTSADDIKQCVSRIRDMLKNHGEVEAETILVHFEGFTENSLEILVYFFTKTTKWQEYLEAKEDINLKIMSILEAMDLAIAFPSRSIYIKNSGGLTEDKPDKSN